MRCFFSLKIMRMPIFADVKSGIIDNLESALDTWNSYMNKVMELITTSPQYFKASGSDTSLLWDVMSSINSFLQGVGLALLVLFFAIGIFKTCSSFSEMKRPEAVLKIFVRFGIAKFAVVNGLEMLMDAFLIVQGTVINLFADLAKRFSIFVSFENPLNGKKVLYMSEFEVPDEIKDAVQSMGFTDIFDKLGLWLITFLAGLFVTVMAFIVLMTVYGRFFRFYMYAAISPLPLSTFASESTQNYGKSYVRNFMAVSLEALVVLLAIVFYAAYAQEAPVLFDANGDASKLVWSYLMELFLMMLILVGTIKASDHIVKEMFGLGG